MASSYLIQCPVLILGTGIAGLSAALKFARQGHDVTLAAKAEAAEGSTRYAQGGIASVWSKQDSFAEHVSDTLAAGAGLCHEDVVRICVQEGPARVRELIELGVGFTRNPSAKDPAEAFDLHREGGHGRRRILHADDLTGLEIERALLERVRAEKRITLLEHHIAIDLITDRKLLSRWRARLQGQRAGERCLGAYVLDIRSGRILTLASRLTVLATGGAGKAYLYTTNPDTATGDGIAMAHRAGARVANLEFMQFHPTCLYHPTAKTFLISEAVRGEGAVLRNSSGEDFVRREHPLGSLAPRDVVARAIDREMKRTGSKHVYLDATRLSDAELRRKFPNIRAQCLALGFDMSKAPIPVVPACHYTCGGVVVDADGRTDIEGLYAVGEVAATGLHGANRLASNSLLEAVVFAHRVATRGSAVLASPGAAPGPPEGAAIPERLPEWDSGHAVEIEEQIDIAANWLEIRSLIWNYVGIVRSDRRLARARRRIELLKAEVNAYYWDFILTKDLIELRNLITVAELIVQCALMRKESRGLHYTVDYPETDDANFRRDTVV